MTGKSDRREFLKTGLVTAAAAITTGTVGTLLGPAKSFAEDMPDLIISYGLDPAAITRAAVDALGGIKRFVKPGNKVVIKPNMSFDKGPEKAANTHPVIVSEVARLCAEAGASRIAVLDHVLGEPRACLRLSKIPEACLKIPNTTVTTIESKRFYKEVNVPQGHNVKTMEVASEVLDADVLIALPKGKSHSSSGVSLSMKGMMGLIKDRMVFHSRHSLHEAIADMVTVIKPHLVIIDGTSILSSGGPGGPGKVIPLNLVVASTDMVAADAQMVALGTWYGKKFVPEQVRHIRIAAERKLGRMDIDKMKVKILKS